jgi:enoyl-CoA hydratase/carnithine racemase
MGEATCCCAEKRYRDRRHDRRNCVSNYITTERQDGIAIVRFNRPDRGNAVFPAVMEMLCGKLDEVIAAPEVKAIVLSHAGRHFVGGADFEWLETLKGATMPEIRDDIYQWFQGAAKRIHLCPKPVVAAIGGAAITVGFELAIAADFRVVTEKAHFQQSWIRLGLIGPLGSLKLLPAMVGWQMAKEIMLRMRPVKGEEAVRIGLATELVAEAEREPRALALARELADLPPLAFRAMKEGLWQGLQASFEDSWATAVLNQAMLLRSEDFGEGLSAVRGQRSPLFNGR